MNDFSLINVILKYSDIGDGRDNGCSHLIIGQAGGLPPKEGVDEPKVQTQILNRRFTLKVKSGRNEVMHSKV